MSSFPEPLKSDHLQLSSPVHRRPRNSQIDQQWAKYFRAVCVLLTRAVDLLTLLVLRVRSQAVVASILRCRVGAGPGFGLSSICAAHRAGGPGAPATPTTID